MEWTGVYGPYLFHYPVHMSGTEFLSKIPVGIFFVVYVVDEVLSPYEAVRPSADKLAWRCTLQTRDTRLTRHPEGPTAQQWFRQNSSLSCHQQLQSFRYNPDELRLPRKTLHKLVADRTGHGRFRSYFRRFKPDCPELAAEAECACGQGLEPNHPLRCAALTGLRRPPLWGRGKKWLEQIEDYYDQQEVLLEVYKP